VLRLALRLPGRRSDEDVPLTLAATEFGGGAFSRLQRPNVQKRLGAGTVSNLLELTSGGVFSFGAPVNTDSAAATVDLLHDQLAEFAQHPPAGVDFPRIRRGSVGGFTGPLETLGGLIGQWGGLVFSGQSSDALQRTVPRLSALTPEEFAEATRRWFDPNHVAIVAIGPAARLEQQLARFGTVEVVRVPTALATTAADTVTATPENLARARAVVDSAFVAHGGLDAFQRIHDSVIEMKIAMGPFRHETPGTLRQMRKEPDRLVSITEFKDFLSRQVLNGNRAWSVTGQAVVDADSAQTAGLKASFQSDLPHVLMALRDPRARVVSRGTDRLLDRSVDALDVRVAGGAFRRYYFDALTHLLEAVDFFDGVPGLAAHRSRRLFGGYETVDGLRWPFREERQIDGQSSMRIEITGVRTNTGVSDKEFEKPVTPSN